MVHDDDLLAQYAAGDPEAFVAFYQRHLTAVLGFFLRRTANPELTADLTAEVFAAALLAAERYRPGERPALAWLYGIAGHKLGDSRRRGRVEDAARRRLALEPLAIDDDDLARVEEMADAGAAEAAVLTLPPDQRDAVLARVVDERPYAEIAKEMQCSELLVRQRVSRGLRALRAPHSGAPMTSFFHDLEDQLRAAARQRTSGAPGPRASRRHRRWAWLAGGIRAVPVLAAVAVTLAVVVGALVLLGHRGEQAPTPPASPQAGNSFAALVHKTPTPQRKREFAVIAAATKKVASRPACLATQPPQGAIAHRAPGRALLAALGVLRRPATAADHIRLQDFGLGGSGMTIFGDGTRRALSAGGTTYYVVPIHVAASVESPAPRCEVLEQAALRQALPTIPAKLRTPTLTLYAAYVAFQRLASSTPAADGVCILGRSRSGSSSECGETLSAIKRPFIPTDDNGDYAGIVPDGVASVTLRFPATASRAATSETAVVRDNLFVLHAPALAQRIAEKLNAQPTVTWRAADGSVLQRLTPPTAASLRNLCLNHPRECVVTTISGSGTEMSASSSSASASTTTAPQMRARASAARAKKK